MYASNSKINDLITSQKQTSAQAAVVAAAAAAHAAAHANNPLSPTSAFYTHANILNTSNRLFKSKINEQQINALETVFKQKQYLNQFEKEQLSNLLNITPLQVSLVSRHLLDLTL